jgi:magnesium chelatase family protein
MDKYLSKISGPLIDRVDVHVEVPPVPYQQLTGEAKGTGSAVMREVVVQARKVQAVRNGGPLVTNSVLSGKQLDRFAKLSDEAAGLLKDAMDRLGLSARAFDKVRRVSRTIADVEGNSAIEVQHVAEAVQYRLLDRQV